MSVNVEHNAKNDDSSQTNQKYIQTLTLLYPDGNSYGSVGMLVMASSSYGLSEQ